MGYTNFVNGNKPNLSAPNLNNMQIELMKLVFPVGSTYITQEETNPSTILNFGTWERVKGKVLVGLDEDDTAFNIIGKTGGEKTHTLTVNEMPEHIHKLNGNTNVTFSDDTINPYLLASAKRGYAEGSNVTFSEGYSLNDTTTVGGGQAHNNLQPYQVVGYMWIRTA